MSDDPIAFEFDGLTELERWLERRAGALDYLVVYDRTDGTDGAQVDRWSVDDLVQPTEGSWQVSAEVRPPGPGGTTRPRPSDQTIVSAVVLWLRNTAERNTVGAPFARFRVRAYGPKGEQKLGTCAFLCRWLPAEDLPATTPGTAAPESVTSGALANVASGYAQLLRLVLDVLGKVHGLHEREQAQLADQVSAGREQVDTLLARLVDERRESLTREAAERHQVTEAGAKLALARDGIKSLSDAAMMWLGKGADPALMGLLTQLTSHPELGSALKDPAVQALLKDSANATTLAQLLRSAAATPANSPAPEVPDGDQAPQPDPTPAA